MNAATEQVCTTFWCSELADGLGLLAMLAGVALVFWGLSKL